MRKFFQPIDKRSRESMVGFLSGHFRYNTMNSWNQSTSYACNMKIHNLGLDSDITNKLYDMIQTREFYDPMDDLMHDFAEQHHYMWQAGMNGRSAGYLVLYQGGKEPSGYKSFCPSCGQKNFTSTTETGNICGVCGLPSRLDFTQTHMKVFTQPGLSTDMYEEFEDWETWQLKERVDLIQKFDKLADAMVQEALYMANHLDVEEETVYVPETRRVLVFGS